MKGARAKIVGSNLFHRQPCILKHYLIGIDRASLRIQNDDRLRNGIDDLPGFHFVSANLLFRDLCRRDIRYSSDKL